jgi:hypothetical protein
MEELDELRKKLMSSQIVTATFRLVAKCLSYLCCHVSPVENAYLFTADGEQCSFLTCVKLDMHT